VRRVALLVLTAAALAAPATAAPPRQGMLVPGVSLGGLRLGATTAEVRAAWGRTYGVCRTCARTTWYFNYRPFEPQGAAVELRRSRVAALFTLWQPAAWRTREGLRLGDAQSRLRAVYGPLPRVRCAGYEALLMRRRGASTVFYVEDGEVWGFGLLAAGVPACRE
jgi:hypothetical protein